MRKTLLLLAAAVALIACTKEVTVDHHITAEFPLVETLQTVSVSIGGTADIVITEDQPIVRYKSLAIYYGANADNLLEDTFWKETSLQWIFILKDAAPIEAFAECGFVDALRARSLSDETVIIYAASNVYDKISDLRTAPVRFNVKVKEGQR
jgi:hypothetical protein